MSKFKILIWLGCFICWGIGNCDSVRSDCGDVNCSGGSPDMSDVTILINYLAGNYDSLCDPALADLDGLPGVTNNDLVALIEFLFDRRLPVACPPPDDTVPPVYDDSLFFRTADLLPGQTRGKIEIWEKTVTEVAAYAILFHMSCEQTDITLDSVYLETKGCFVGDYVLSDWSDRAVCLFRDFSLEQPVPPGERKLAALYFTVNPENFVREIEIDTVHNDIGQGLIYTTFVDDHICGFKPNVIFNHCCWGGTGNVDCSESEDPDIADITRLIDYLFLSGTPLCCVEEGNTCGNVDTEPDISDVLAIIDYLYLSHSPLLSCP